MQYLNVSIIYLFARLMQRGADFVVHWYRDAFFRFVDWTLSTLERLDRRFAVRITAKNWLQPLYQDYTLIGYVWGFIFRTGRIAIGLVVYLAVVLVALAGFIAWALFPLYCLYRIFHLP
ncbi:MAG: hypothetical protein KGI60_04075 [Patescibacteria group bacterium]|nr:hypothetical protein [Patescibacteria group bacterium]